MVPRREGQKDGCRLREQGRKNGGHAAILAALPTHEVSRTVKTSALKSENPGCQSKLWHILFMLPCVSYKASPSLSQQYENEDNCTYLATVKFNKIMHVK